MPCSIKYHLTEKAGRESRAVYSPLAANPLRHRTVDLLVPGQQSTTPTIAVPPLQTLSQSLQTLTQQITQIQAYVSQFTSGTTAAAPADIEVGKYLLDAVGRWKADAATVAGAEESADGEEDDEAGVKRGLQDALSVSYLSALVRSQVELSARLNLLA